MCDFYHWSGARWYRSEVALVDDPTGGIRYAGPALRGLRTRILIMGSMIHLTLGRIQMDWGKNEGFNNHAALFRSRDLTQIPYYYAGEADDAEFTHLPIVRKSDTFSYRLITEMKEGYSAPLSVVAQRLQLLGYTDVFSRHEFEAVLEVEDANHDFTFDELKAILQSADFGAAAFDQQLGSEDFAEFVAERVLPSLGSGSIGRLKYDSMDDGQIAGLSAYSILQLLASNPTACDLPVTWQFADVAEGGYVPRDNFLASVPQESRFLIVTEGSSDVQIIKHALDLLWPELADFFDFVDMHENYPFSGTGSLYNFVCGLISIRIQNNIVVIFDNDAEGVFNWERSTKLNRLKNMRVAKLPDRECFRTCRTVGPTGEQTADINGKAAAIECYLDIGPMPLVRWTNYDHRRDCYQGHIVCKEKLAKEFLAQRVLVAGYDYSGLEAVLNMLIQECTSIAEDHCKTSLAIYC
jgi:hypothetical protein